MINTRQAAQQLGVTERQVQRYVRIGLLEAQAIGDYVNAPLIISEESLNKLIALRAQHPQLFRKRTKRRADTGGS